MQRFYHLDIPTKYQYLPGSNNRDALQVGFFATIIDVDYIIDIYIPDQDWCLPNV